MTMDLFWETRESFTSTKCVIFPIFLSTFVSTFEATQMPFSRKKSSQIQSYFTLIQTLTYK